MIRRALAFLSKLFASSASEPVSCGICRSPQLSLRAALEAGWRDYAVIDYFGRRVVVCRACNDAGPLA